MAPLPDNLTARLWVDYEVANTPHTFMVRYIAAAQPLPDLLDGVGAVLNFIAPVLHQSWVVMGVRQSDAGNNFSLPVDTTGTALAGLTGEYSGTWDPVNDARECVWVARSLGTGRRTRFSLYGGMFATPANYRFGPGEIALSSAPVIAALNASSQAGFFSSIDGTAARWYPYVNVNYNSYWERQQRNN